MDNQPFLDTHKEVYNGSTLQDSGRLPKSSLISKEYVRLGTTEQDSGKISRDAEQMSVSSLMAFNAQKLKIFAELTRSNSKKYSELVKVINGSINGLKMAFQEYENIQARK